MPGAILVIGVCVCVCVCVCWQRALEKKCQQNCVEFWEKTFLIFSLLHHFLETQLLIDY